MYGDIVAKYGDIVAKFEESVNETIASVKNSPDLWAELSRHARELSMAFLQRSLEKLDEKLKEEYVNKHGWRCVRKSYRTINTFQGTLTFERYLLYDKNTNPHYLLDEVLGIAKRMRYSPDVWQTTAKLAVSPGMTYRLSASAIEMLTGMSISHTTVKRLVDTAGQAQAEQDKHERQEIFERGEIPEAKPAPQLFVEADGLYIKGVDGKKIEIKNMLTYLGWEYDGKRCCLRSKQIYSSLESAEDFWESGYASIRHKYNLDGSEVIFNGDGAQWIGDHVEEFFAEASNLVRQLDPFHVKRSIRRGLSKQPALSTQLQRAIAEHDYQLATEAIDTALSNAECAKEKSEIVTMRNYLMGHWEFLKDWRQVAKHVPDNAKGMGAIESNQRKLAFRMKRRGMKWSKQGALAVVKVQQAITNGSLSSVLSAHRPSVLARRKKVKMLVRRMAAERKKRVSELANIGRLRYSRINVANAPSSSFIGRLAHLVGRIPSLTGYD